MNNDVNISAGISQILIVDDVPDNLKVLGNMLKMDGHKVRPVLNGMQALEAAATEKPDLILLDIMMPEMNGYEVARRLKANPDLADIPVIFISSLSDISDIVKAFNEGGVDYIIKPFRNEEVRARVTTHLELSRQKKQLQQLNNTKNKLFSIISHDLRGPVGSIKQGLEMITSGKKLDENFKNRLLDELKIASKTTFNLLENLLNWSRIQSHSIDLNPKSFVLNEAIINNVDLLQPNAKLKSINVNINAYKLINVFADNDAVNLVIRNLLTNAIKFTPENGTVTVSASDKGKEIEVVISDTGVGMSEEVIAKIFRATSNYTTFGTKGEKGSGLGLILCKEFVEKNGGELSVKSEVGSGTSFAFTIPAA